MYSIRCTSFQIFEWERKFHAFPTPRNAASRSYNSLVSSPVKVHAVEYLLEPKGHICGENLIHKLQGRKKQVDPKVIPDNQPALATGKIPTSRAPRISSLFLSDEKTSRKNSFASTKWPYWAAYKVGVSYSSTRNNNTAPLGQDTKQCGQSEQCS